MSNLKKYLNSTYQLMGTRHYTLSHGYAKGVSAIDTKTGSGFEYTVVKDRALDISLASYKGINLTYIARNGEVSPLLYNPSDGGWMKSFFGGLLTTCGPENIGKASTVDGISYAQHGHFSNTPAVNIIDSSSIENGISIEGDIIFSTLADPYICVHRTIKSPAFKSSVTIHDSITNHSFLDTPLIMLYHTNYGYPFLSESTKLFTENEMIEAYDDYSLKNIDDVYKVSPPDKGNKEKNYFHHMKKGCSVNKAVLVNTVLNIGILIEFSPNLPYLTHCKIEQPGNYFMAVEPCNTLCLGREEITKRNLLPYIKAGETIEYIITFSILEKDELSEYI